MDVTAALIIAVALFFGLLLCGVVIGLTLNRRPDNSQRIEEVHAALLKEIHALRTTLTNHGEKIAHHSGLLEARTVSP